jgi:hypothetical protein
MIDKTVYAFCREDKPPREFAVPWSQMFIALFGLSAMYLALEGTSPYHQYAAVVGLAGQPFWLKELWGKWGMFAVSVGFTLVYLRAIYFQLLPSWSWLIG